MGVGIAVRTAYPIRRTLTLTLTHMITAVLSKWKCRTCAQNCAYSSVHLDKSRVEKEFTHH